MDAEIQIQLLKNLFPPLSPKWEKRRATKQVKMKISQVYL